MITSIADLYPKYGDLSHEFVKQCIAFTFPESTEEGNSVRTLSLRDKILSLKELLSTMERRIEEYESSQRTAQQIAEYHEQPSGSD